jgi:hypothetical protein
MRIEVELVRLADEVGAEAVVRSSSVSTNLPH